MSTLYLRTSKNDISKYVILSGDPWRVELLKESLDKPKHIAFNREFNTYTGLYEGVPVTISSTGIGAPSAAIAMEELYECGMEVVVRMGTIMGFKDNMLGKVLIPIGSMRLESTSDTYVPKAYPAVSNAELVNCMNKGALLHNRDYINGLICTVDGYYSQMKESKLSKEINKDVLSLSEEIEKYNICGIDMETSLILVLGNLMNIKACSVTMTTVLKNLEESLEGNDRAKAENDLCKIVLDGIKIFHEEDINHE
ncbi:nucleoside phosphorylase [Tepidanaerobacter syntrophicus]|uniref:nucleoside phosphorylase n=1 Tax=Tepidanaerobacter syntrophicus TaxID=224999 RepID=UPI001BD5A5B9|nr:nucleoside phosphorylase [Tepidanaerobacter syntrophicus]